MSQEARYEVKTIKVQNIKGNASIELLKRSVDNVIEQFSGIISEEFVMQNKVEKCLLALKFAEFPNGIGINIDKNGEIQIKYETSTKTENFPNKIFATLKQYYNKFAVEKALEKIGYKIKTREVGILGIDKVIIVEGNLKEKKAIKAIIDEKNQIKIDYKGFQSDKCLIEEDFLIKNISELGVELVKRKNESRIKNQNEINLEIGDSEANNVFEKEIDLKIKKKIEI